MTFSGSEGDITEGKKLGIRIGDKADRIEAVMARKHFHGERVPCPTDKPNSACVPGDVIYRYHRHYATVTYDAVDIYTHNGVVTRIIWSANLLNLP